MNLKPILTFRACVLYQRRNLWNKLAVDPGKEKMQKTYNSCKSVTVTKWHGFLNEPNFTIFKNLIMLQLRCQNVCQQLLLSSIHHHKHDQCSKKLAIQQNNGNCMRNQFSPFVRIVSAKESLEQTGSSVLGRKKMQKKYNSYKSVKCYHWHGFLKPTQLHNI